MMLIHIIQHQIKQLFYPLSMFQVLNTTSINVSLNVSGLTILILLINGSLNFSGITILNNNTTIK